MRVIKLRKVVDLTSLSRSSIYTLIAKGQFPRPFRLSLRSVGWKEETVVQWIEQKEKEGKSHVE